MLKYCGITIDLVNIHWLKEGTARLTREEQEAHIEENYKA